MSQSVGRFKNAGAARGIQRGLTRDGDPAEYYRGGAFPLDADSIEVADQPAAYENSSKKFQRSVSDRGGGVRRRGDRRPEGWPPDDRR
jgi:hypothetical protein